MQSRKFSVFDAVSYGFRSVVDNIRLFFLLEVTVTVCLIGVIIIAGLLNKSALIEIMNVLHATKECISAECLMLTKSMLLPIFKQHAIPFLLTFLFLYLLFAAFYAGYQKVMLDFYDNNATSVKELFSGFKYLHKIAIALLLYGLIVLFGLILIFPGIYLGLRFTFFGYFIVDKNTGIFESFKQSWHATQGQTWRIFSLAIIRASLVSISGGILIFLVLPLTDLAYVFAYRNLTD